MKNLIIKLLSTSLVRSPDFDLSIQPQTRVKVFTIETEELLCKVWNSSNDNSFDREYVAKEISSQLLEDETMSEGSVSYNLSEIMFEITEK